MTTPYHAKYYAHELTRRSIAGDSDRLSMALFDACVDLNPHQIEGALFALRSPISKGVLLADEVGLGKTIEAGLVLCQHWAERRRRLLVICPASIRKQWAVELQEKFSLPSVILDATTYRELKDQGQIEPFESAKVVIVSFHYAARNAKAIRQIGWDLVVLDEAHKLRNAYRESNRLGQAIRWALEEKRKLLLTATPLQNSLMELYGLASIIDENIFGGDAAMFRTQYSNVGGDLEQLRQRLQPWCKRTLRRQVLEYINYTARRAITRPFRPSDEEHKLYEAISDLLLREETYAIPHRQRHLTTLILRKLLASSSHAIAATLDTMKARLEKIQKGVREKMDIVDQIIAGEDIDDEYLDELIDTGEGASIPPTSPDSEDDEPKIDPKKLAAEVDELNRLAQWARSIGIDTKTRTLLAALDIGFGEMEKMGAQRKALIFTESRRTQTYLKDFLETNGYAGKVIVFNGTNSDQQSKTIYENWLAANTDNGRATGSRAIDTRQALIEYFRDHATIMLATEAGAEGVNMQFCAQVINYDLPWNPQRIEQRIGRCHRYGQKHDVVVINFLNERNEADQRVYQLLSEKFQLFTGLFGASDEVIGTVESGVDFEKRVLAIYQSCRTSEQIAEAFKTLQAELEQQIKARMDDTRRQLLENFDEDVHARLKFRLDATKQQLDRFTRLFWALTKYMLAQRAKFKDEPPSFDLSDPPSTGTGLIFQTGHYTLISKNQPNVTGEYLYRLSHPLGEWVIDTAKLCETPTAKVVFNISGHPTRIKLVEDLKGQSGWLTLRHLIVESFDREEYLLFSGVTDEGKSLDQETLEKLFNCTGSTANANVELDAGMSARLEQEATRHQAATISRSLEANSKHFQEERDRLEQWAQDAVAAAERDLKQTKEQINALRRDARLAPNLDEQLKIQKKLSEKEKALRRQRQEIFDLEDQINGKRDALISGLERRLTQRTQASALYTIRWSVQ
jgi:hypothetical protein